MGEYLEVGSISGFYLIYANGYREVLRISLFCYSKQSEMGISYVTYYIIISVLDV